MSELARAIRTDNVVLIRKLLETGAIVEAEIFVSIGTNHNKYHLIDIFLEYNYNINVVDEDHNNILMRVIKHNTKSTYIEKLLKAGANVNNIDSNGNNILLILCDKFNMDCFKNDYSDLFRMLLNYGADLNYIKYRSCLIELLKMTNKVYMEMTLEWLLKDKFKNINYVDDNGRSALLQALITRVDNTSIIKALLEKGSKLNIIDYFTIEYILQFNGQYSDLIDKKLLLLMQYGLKLNTASVKLLLRKIITESDGDKYLPIIRLLLPMIEDINTHNISQPNDVILALRNDNFCIVELLLVYGANYKQICNMYPINNYYSSLVKCLDMEKAQHWKIRQLIISMETHKKYQREEVLVEMTTKYQNFSMSPTNILAKLLSIRWSLSCNTTEQVYNQMDKSLKEYFGINNLETFEWKITAYLKNIE